MVEYRLLAENESVQVASQANALPPLKGNDVTPSGLLPSPRSRPTCSRMEWRPVVSSDIFMMLLIAECRGNRPALKFIHFILNHSGDNVNDIKNIHCYLYWSHKKGVIFMCYSSEKLIALNTLHEVVPTWYSFCSWFNRSNADKVSCSRTQYTDVGIWTVNLCNQKPTF